MDEASDQYYDVVIIGAGIGGLVCGCYLAKAGMKVLIAEQHHRPGGYCTSFSRHGYRFDAAAHCFGSYREGGLMRNILRGLELDKRLNIRRPDPTDTVVTPDYRVSFWNELEKTIEEFQSLFPRERNNVRRFFKALVDTELKSFARMRRLSLKDLLDQTFTDDRLKAILSFPLLAFGGLPPSLLSACVGAQFYTEFLLDGGYIPEGGMQMLSDQLASRFKEFGGEIRLSTLVTRITLENKKAVGIVVNSTEFIPARRVISNCDARQTFFSLLSDNTIDPTFNATLSTMIPSASNYVLYLGMDNQFQSPLRPGTIHFYFNHYDAEKAYQSIHDDSMGSFKGYAVRVSRDLSAVYVEMLAVFKSAEYWKQAKKRVADMLIERLENEAIPSLSKHIVCQDAATPHTLYRYTKNFDGASYGWAGTLSQTIVPGFRKPPFVQNLYLVGHWTTLAVGISGVAYVGYDTANMLLRRK